MWGLVIPFALLCACGTSNEAPADGPKPSGGQPAPAESLSMGGAKSVTKFFVTSRGVGKGGDLGGLAGADAHCQALAAAEGSGDHTWRAYLSTVATATEQAINARDRLGSGPWYNADGLLIAPNIEQLHSAENKMTKDTAVTERLDPVNGVGDTPVMHDIMTGSRPDGTAFEADGRDLTCRNWTSSGGGGAQVGHHDRKGDGEGADSWNSAHPSEGCGQQDLERSGGAGLFYCFAAD